jgi:hypothetical protein
MRTEGVRKPKVIDCIALRRGNDPKDLLWLIAEIAFHHSLNLLEKESKKGSVEREMADNGKKMRWKVDDSDEGRKMAETCPQITS